MDAFLSNVDWPEIGIASWDTLVMVGLSLLFSVLAGLPIGVLLFLTGKRQLLEQPVAYAVLSFVVNVLRSVPFIILLIVMIPFTVMLIGTSLGVAGAIPPLVAGGAPFFSPLVETSLAAGSASGHHRRHYGYRDYAGVLRGHVWRYRRRWSG